MDEDAALIRSAAAA